jgi:hypothetical protein
MLIATDKNGISRRVIYNENVLLVDRGDTLSFKIKDDKVILEFTLNITFSDEGKELSTTGNVSEDGKTFNMILHQWDNSMGTELTQPIELATNTGKKIWLKFKTTADKKNSFRSFHLTIWVEE